MPPNQHHLYKPKGRGIGLGEPLPGHGARVLQKDSWAAAVVDELNIEPHDICVDKHRISGFWDTPLDSILRNLGTRTILFAGVNTDQCVLHTLTDANFLGYGCVLLEDCCATTSPAFCTEATVWKRAQMLRLRHRFGRRAARAALVGPEPQAERRAFTASLSTRSTASESSQPRQASVMLWP